MIRLNMNKVMIVEKIKNLKLKDKEKLKKKIYLQIVMNNKVPKSNNKHYKNNINSNKRIKHKTIYLRKKIMIVILNNSLYNHQKKINFKKWFKKFNSKSKLNKSVFRNI